MTITRNRTNGKIRSLGHFLCCPTMLSFFGKKGTTDKKNTFYAVLKGHFWIINFWTTLLVDSPILSFFAELLDRVGVSRSVTIFVLT